jgi:hypothetical protein
MGGGTGIVLCGDNGKCQSFTKVGKYNLKEYDLYDNVVSVTFTGPSYSHKMHVVLWTEEDQKGSLYDVRDTINEQLSEPFVKHIRSIEIYEMQGIWLCDESNFSGKCLLLNGQRDTDKSIINLQDYNINDKVSSIQFSSEYEWFYHIVLWENENGTGALFHADYSVTDLPAPFNNKVSSVKIYEKQGVWLAEEKNYKKGTGSWDNRLFDDGKVGKSNIDYKVSSIKFSKTFLDKYQIVLYTGANQTGEKYIAGNSITDIGDRFRNNIKSVEFKRTF